MLKSIWMHAWDLEGIEPDELIAFLKDCGLNACNLAFSYHGGRMLLPRHRRHKVYEQDLSAVYFPANESLYRNCSLQPHVAPQARLLRPFVDAAREAGFGVNAWAALCHNDRLGGGAPECCIENVFGDRYSYALCPANPEARGYIKALCADIAAFDGVARLDLEAFSFLGFDHQSPHDKRGVPLTPPVTWLLSICFCADCRRRLSEAAEEVERKTRGYLNNYFEKFDEARPGELRAELEKALGRSALEALLEMRRQVITSLLDEVRAAVGEAHINLRLATLPLFIGGKTALDWSQLAGRVDSATNTFLGASSEQMAAELERLPRPEQRPVPVYGGFSFHHPDCLSESDVRRRFALLRQTRLDGVLFYCYGMAAVRHFKWLKKVLKEE